MSNFIVLQHHLSPRAIITSGPPHGPGQASACPALLPVNLVGNPRWGSASFWSALAPPTSMPPPGTRQLQLPGPLSLGDLCRNPGLGMGSETLNHCGHHRIPSGLSWACLSSPHQGFCRGWRWRGVVRANLHLQQTRAGQCFVNTHKNRAIAKQRKC